MKKFQLVEKIKETQQPAIWEITNDGDGWKHAKLLLPSLGNPEHLCIGRLIKENKRGWTIRVFWLTNKSIDVFVPREAFDVVNMD
jgi:hypothetical protein